MVLTDEQKKVVKSTAPVLKENGKKIATIFYKKIQDAHPELRNFFNQTNQTSGSQPMALAHTLYCAAEHIESLETLMPQVEQIANKHRALLVKPEHYPIVGKFLLEAIAEFLGDKATPEILESWKATYSVISGIFIGLEKKMYADLGGDERDKHFIDFKIVKKEQVAGGPTFELTLERQDGGKLHSYQPGQYVAIRLEKDGLTHNRFYGLTTPFNGQTYSVLVRKEPQDASNAVVSNEIVSSRGVGSTISVSNPSGTFLLVKDAASNVFISGGVGIGPIGAMIQDLNKNGKSASTTLIHCVRAADQSSYGDKLGATLPSGRYVSLVGEELSKGVLSGKLQHGSQVYVSGADGFVTLVDKVLAECGHPKSQIHSEAIGPTLAVLNRCC
jgi:nitric oxide dioxygenase